jgi:hypothetical protein
MSISGWSVVAFTDLPPKKPKVFPPARCAHRASHRTHDNTNTRPSPPPELEARGEVWLRRRLHAAIVREYLDAGADSFTVLHSLLPFYTDSANACALLPFYAKSRPTFSFTVPPP